MATDDDYPDDASVSDAVLVQSTAPHAREMYRRFLESEYPAALAMAEDVLRERPEDVMALAIATECRTALAHRPLMVTVPAPALTPSEGGGSEPAFDVVMEHELTLPYTTATRGEPGREMCQRFLDSDHPAALALAETLLQDNPHDRMARAIAEQCRAALESRGSGQERLRDSLPPRE